MREATAQSGDTNTGVAALDGDLGQKNGEQKQKYLRPALQIRFQNT